MLFKNSVRTSKTERCGRLFNIPAWYSKVPGSNLGPEAGYPAAVFRRLSQSLQEMLVEFLKIRPRPLPYASFLIYRSLITPSFDAI
jgi:hypothetical protein